MLYKWHFLVGLFATMFIAHETGPLTGNSLYCYSQPEPLRRGVAMVVPRGPGARLNYKEGITSWLKLAVLEKGDGPVRVVSRPLVHKP